MPADIWSTRPSVRPHGYGFSIPVAVTQEGSGTEEDPVIFRGIRVETRSLTAVDIQAGIEADPDAGIEHLPEALALALDEAAPTIQPQLDAIIDTLLEA